VKALLICPAFSPRGFWNYKAVCELTGAKYPASPLGMITMAALLPTGWEVRLLDMNTSILRDADIDWADLVFVGGMLPQESRVLALIARAHGRGRKVVVGGPDPSSRPEVYRSADYLVLGEAERSMPAFLEDLAGGATGGTYTGGERPDLVESPIPRFDLLDLTSYMMIGIQFSRGCPFGCEFCDVIKLYGRTPRTKEPHRLLAELDALYALGYRGHVDFVDDNLIGSRAKAKEALRAVRGWSEAHGHPFYFSTEASIDLARDPELLELMRDLDFRYVFVGIESADRQVLAAAHKRQNVGRDIVEDLHTIYRHGIVVNAGFILGFDGETADSASGMIDVIERGRIGMAMVGLLFALPGTELAERLTEQKRLLREGGPQSEAAESTEIDQTTTGLNFVTARPKGEILSDFRRVLDTTYSPGNYFDRCLALCRIIEVRPRFRPPPAHIARYGLGFLKTVVRLGLAPSTAYYFWRNLLVVLIVRPSALETLASLMAMYLHFGPQTRFVSRSVTRAIEDDRRVTDRAFAGMTREARGSVPGE
jgi:radical SAM superfamily enzyme YgiQ (UPF0313 family)